MEDSTDNRPHRERVDIVADVKFPSVGDVSALTLPNHIPFDRVVLSCEKSIEFGKTSRQFRQEWHELFTSIHSVNFIGASFWYTINSIFANGNKSFTEFSARRMADCFRSLYNSVSKHMKIHFFSDYPSVASKAVVFSIFLAFPKGRGLLKKSLQMDILKDNFMYISGWIPRRISADGWMLDLGGEVLEVGAGTQSARVLNSKITNCIDGICPALRTYIAMNKSHSALPFAKSRKYDSPICLDLYGSDIRSGGTMTSNVKPNLITGKLVMSEMKEERIRIEKRFKEFTSQEVANLASYILVPYCQKRRYYPYICFDLL